MWSFICGVFTFEFLHFDLVLVCSESKFERDR